MHSGDILFKDTLLSEWLIVLQNSPPHCNAKKGDFVTFKSKVLLNPFAPLKHPPKPRSQTRNNLVSFA